MKIAFEYVGLDWRKYVKIDKNLYRPCEVPVLKGDSLKAIKKLSWNPKQTKFEDLIHTMVDADLERYKKEAIH